LNLLEKLRKERKNQNFFLLGMHAERARDLGNGGTSENAFLGSCYKLLEDEKFA
jgi:hypothetical protein